MKLLKIIALYFLLILPILSNSQVVPVGFFQNKAANIADNGSANALDFDGVDDYVVVNSDSRLNITSSITLSAWVYRNQVGKFDCILGKDQFSANNGYSLWIYNDNKLTLRFGSSRVYKSAQNIAKDKWTHVAATFDGTTARLYIDGVLSTSLAATAASSNSGALYIGTAQDAVGVSSYNFSGKLDKVTIWNIARTQAQIQSSMYTELAGSESGLLAYYNFNQGIAGGNNSIITTVSDKTANILNGTLTNFAKTGSTSNFVVSATPALLIPKSNAYSAITTSGTFPFNPLFGGGNISFLGGPTYGSSNTWGPHQLFDNTRTNFDWCNDGVINHFGQFTFPKPVNITKIFLVPRSQGDNFPASVTLKVDGVTIGTYAAKNISTNDGLQLNYSGIGHFIAPNVSGIVWRLEFSVANVYIGELEFLGF
jgi:hypothetical protein